MKVIRCPHCQSLCNIGGGYYHDEKLNIRCKICHKIMFATTDEDEKELQKLFTRPIREDHHHTHTATQAAYTGYPTTGRHAHDSRHGHQQQHVGAEPDDYD